MTPVTCDKRGAKGDSNPRPLAPEARIIPLDHWPSVAWGNRPAKILEPGIEPGTYCVLGSRHNQLDHSSFKSILGGTRTHNLEIRSLTPYPLGHEDTAMGDAAPRCAAARREKPGSRNPESELHL
jgi:hypothetical protein